MQLSRRCLLRLWPLLSGRVACTALRIDRRSLVARHNPVLRAINLRSPLSVGNGELAFTADVTGLQTFPELYERATPLCTQSQWGWHSFPNPQNFSLDQFRMTGFDAHGRAVGYPTSAQGQQEAYNWLRENPHRLHLGRIGVRVAGASGTPARAEDLSAIEQTLDLWSGILKSRFRIGDAATLVETCVHPALDLLAVRIESPLVRTGRLTVVIEFPYGSPDITAADWSRPDRHKTTVLREGSSGTELLRELDRDRYYMRFRSGAALQREGAHRFLLAAPKNSARLDFVCAFAPQPGSARLPSAEATLSASRNHWQRFWSEGGAVELAHGPDPRARELERRVVLSQYQTAIQCAGSLPPQETGLTCNSWNGKYHLEMHFWHAAHFAVWGRTALLERSLAWYQTILPRAQETARRQGYRGARWPKMVGPEGGESPSPIGPLLIWQQPHPILLAELCYRAQPGRSTLERYRELVFASAEFLESFAFYDAPNKRYVLGPPVIPAQENHPPRETRNPTFELEYWAEALEIARQWRVRLGLGRRPAWDTLAATLAPLPVKQGVYLAHENCPQTYTERNHDHPSMLAALGMLRGVRVDRETMGRTLDKVLECWTWPDTWGWDYPLMAMTAARLGRPQAAVEALLLDTPKNTWLANGHTWQRENLPLYLPSNGGLLLAAGMMAGGWEGAPQRPAPGFPERWQVASEGLQRYI